MGMGLDRECKQPDEYNFPRVFEILSDPYTLCVRYDFASYSFDAAWLNALCTFACGGCLCVPSEAERRDDLAGSLERMKATHVDLTPSVVRVLPKKTIQGLQTLIVAGEALRPEDARQWAPLVDLKNVYGPCECTPTATIESISSGGALSLNGNIGKGVGLCTWIVDPRNGDSLVPIGATGELLLEGPLVGAGYLGDPSKTAAAFIEDPAWLKRGRPNHVGRRGRLYRTGDLVRYNVIDGSLIFMGRKDNQVKINGQRVELSEIEYQMERLEHVRQSAVLIPKTGSFSNRVVGLFSLQHEENVASVQSAVELRDDIKSDYVENSTADIRTRLDATLPPYMVPSVWIPLRSLPLSTAGKLNYKALHAWLVTVDNATVTKITTVGTKKTASTRKYVSDIERVLIDACSRVLNVATAEIDLGRSFVANGGDSISAMRLVPQCRALDLTISVGGLLRSKTLAELAESATLNNSNKQEVVAVYEKEDFETSFGLSPIQRWFFTQSSFGKIISDPGHYYNQGFYLHIKQPVRPKAVSDAIAEITNQHSMLRARFQQQHTDSELCTQRVLPPGVTTYRFQVSELQDMAQLEALAQEIHQTLNIEEGPTFAADLCMLPNGAQYLLLIAHHLIVDLVSWRIILNDIETLLKGEKLLPSLPFQAWNRLQIDKAQALDPEKVLSTMDTSNELAFWNFTPETPNTASDHDLYEQHIDAEITSHLLRDANAALGTEPVELLLSAVWDAFFRVFPSREALTIFNEGHGREPWSSDIDLSRTVGWFTTLSPINVSREAITRMSTSQVTDVVRFVKDARRRLPANGRAYFASRYLTEQGSEAFKTHESPTMEVEFNYLGLFQELEHDDSLFNNVSLKGVADEGPKAPSSSIINIEVSIADGKAKYFISANRHVKHQDLIQSWVSQIGLSLHTICSELVSIKPSTTLCDYPLLSLDYRRLDRLLSTTIPHIESINNAKVIEVLPCTPTVNGMLLSQVKQVDLYKTCEVYEITLPTSHTAELSLAELAEAWQRVIAHQPALRTVIVDGVEQTGGFTQFILDSYRGDIIFTECDDNASAVQPLSDLPPMKYKHAKPLHRLALCRTLEGKVFCRIDMSHAITDGASNGLIIDNWSRSYQGTLAVGSIDLLATSRAFSQALVTTPIATKLSYWKTKMTDVVPSFFPRLASTPVYKEEETFAASIDISQSLLRQIRRFCETESVTPASLFQAAWAVTLSSYAGTDSACFGYLSSGRDSVADIDKSIGAYTNMMICRVEGIRNRIASHIVREVYDQMVDALAYQHCSLAEIQHSLGLGSSNTLFNTILTFQMADTDDKSSSGLSFRRIGGQDPTEYDIAPSILFGDDQANISFDYKPSFLSHSQADRVLSLFRSTISALSNVHLPLSIAGDGLSNPSALQMISDEDLTDIWSTNATALQPVEACVHEIFMQTAKDQPDTQAVCAWDGSLTYRELDELSTTLAHQLAILGVDSDTIVPLCFEKSMWQPVAVLGVMKAGGASVALDVSLPPGRLRTIADTVNARFVLSSQQNAPLASQLCDNGQVVIVSQSQLSPSGSPEQIIEPTVGPHDRLYVVFTSGSTGTPKGATVTHSNFATAIALQQSYLCIDKSSRVFDFTSYAFDVAWSNILHTLTAGGCLCIPSDEDRRSDLAASIQRLRANYCHLTPSVGRILDAAVFHGLKTLHFSGEPLQDDDLRLAGGSITVINSYGPAECSVTSSAAQITPGASTVPGIGKALGTRLWIADPIDGSYLVPIGCIGELWIEGPLVGSGYLGEPEKTEISFVKNPSWLLRGTPGVSGRPGRLYRTGDLVRYNTDGSLAFIGRKDNQIKINGQRVELGEIESAIRDSLRTPTRVVVEFVAPKNTAKPVLMTFMISGQSGTTNPSSPELRLDQVECLTTGLREKLALRLPSYMVPTAYVPITMFPTTATGKTDRRLLRKIGEELTSSQLSRLSGPYSDRKPPSTQLERQLQTIWSSVLGIKANEIGVDDSFLQIGADSITAMKLVAAASEQGMFLTVADVLKNPKLGDMASVVAHSQPRAEEEQVPSFSLLRNATSVGSVLDAAAGLCNIAVAEIEDLFPCTPLQEGLLALTASRSGDYVARHVLKLAESVDKTRFQDAWRQVVAVTPILRTRIVDVPGQGLVQAVHDEQVAWSSTQKSMTEYIRIDEQTPMGLGTPLVRFGLVKENEQTDACWFVWTIHHAVYDGWSMPLLLQSLEQAYETGICKVRPRFQHFVKHVEESRKNGRAKEFWQAQFQGLEAPVFPKLPRPDYQPRSDSFFTRYITNLKWPKTNVTPSTILRAAWAIVMATFTSSKDVVFGVTVAGRQANIPGIMDTIGPTIVTIPVRVQLNYQGSVEQLLAQAQDQSTEMIAFEQAGLQYIRHFSPEAASACQFQSLLVLEAEERGPQHSCPLFDQPVREDSGEDEFSAAFDTYAITILCGIEKEGARLHVSFDSGIVDRVQMFRLTDYLENVLRHLSNMNNLQSTLSNMTAASEEDLSRIWTWNATVPEAVEGCVHDLIIQTARLEPAALAVLAWDGCWTYQELDALSTNLAYALLQLEIGSKIVPLYFEKSKWMPIAMLAVMKAGRASVALDANYPEERLCTIINAVAPTVTLCSSKHSRLARRLSHGTVLTIDEFTISKLTAPPTNYQMPTVDPSELLYVIFTSGTSGTPKGVQVTHRNFRSAMPHQQKYFGYKSSSRVLDFASYSFDAAWNNFAYTLSNGGCLCVSSEKEHMDNLATTIDRLGITHADLTPSLASVLPLATIAKLDTLIIGGEQLSVEDGRRWSAVTTVQNMYGPSETTPTATVATINSDSEPYNGSIGKGAGLCVWVADPATGQSLLPIGAIGELLLEGPLVGPGYLNDAEKTSAAFIEDPAFLVCGPPGSLHSSQKRGNNGRRGRLFRTGDLCRYNPDGSLTFVARKDTQVKINGQRVELHEIEGCIGRYSPVQQSAVLLPRSGPCANRLTALISLREDQKTQDGRTIELHPQMNEPQVKHHINKLRSIIESSLPSYMAPSIWVVLKGIPRNTSGKVNYAGLGLWLADIDAITFEKITGAASKKLIRQPETDAERILCRACSYVLDIPNDQIDLERSFVANGGDSISAMRLVPQCRASNLTMSVASLLKSKSLAALASTLKVATSTISYKEEYFNQNFGLSPIQRWFFAQLPPDMATSPDYYCNQGFYIRLRSYIPMEEVCKAIATVVRRHSMLRARFHRSDGEWKQRVLPPCDTSHHFSMLRLQDLDEIKSIARRRHHDIDICNGPVFAADLCELPSGSQILILIAHHLVIDLVSWRIILEDLESLLSGTSTLQPSLPFQNWIQLQTEKAQTPDLDPEHVLSTECASNNLDFWNFKESVTSNAEVNHTHQLVEIGTETTALLLQRANAALNTEPVDLLLAAVWHAFFHVFADRHSLTIFNEAHGREPWDSEIDLSQTVGWFTTVSPIHVLADIANDPVALVRFVKDARRRLPANGWAYYTSRYLNQKGIQAFQSHNSTMEVEFNYHGQFQLLEKEEGVFDQMSFDEIPEEGPRAPAGALFTFNVSIVRGKVHYSISSNSSIGHQDRIQAWFTQLETSLRALCITLASQQQPMKTLCDFSFLELDYQRLDDLVRNVILRVESLNNNSKVVEALPCSPTVNGMLLSQMKQPEVYNTREAYEITTSSSRSLRLEDIADAWQRIVAYQPSLRTVFVEGIDKTEGFTQLILDSAQGEVIYLEAEDKQSALAGFGRLVPLDYREAKPPHRVTLCQTADNRIICQVEMSHTITDGASTSIMLRDWATAYDTGILASMDLLDTSREFTRALLTTPKATKIEFWNKKLSGIEHSYFPRMATSHIPNMERDTILTAGIDISKELFSQMQRFCEAASVTPASVFQTAWALTLASYAGTKSVCFGYLGSGRDMPVAGLDLSIGAYTNMIIYRLDNIWGRSSRELVQETYDQMVQDIDFQHCALADIQRSLDLAPGQALYNSILTIQALDSGSKNLLSDEPPLSFRSIDGQDPTEVSSTYSLTKVLDMLN
jgi:amino acid adenylation domain-containing protein/non-ribosomal peptide synthase protein (TIGR01720 family)